MLNRHFTPLLFLLLVAMLHVLSSPAHPTKAVAQRPPSEPCPLSEDACEFATLVNTALLTGDLDRVLEHVQRETHACSTDDIKGDTPFLFLCRRAQVDEPRRGIPWQFSEMGDRDGVEFRLYFPEASYRSMLAAFVARAEPSESDALGSGRFRFAGFSCSTGGDEPGNCSRSYVLTFMSISCGRDGPGREVLTFQVERPGQSGVAVITRTGSVRARQGDTRPLANLIPWPIEDSGPEEPRQSDRSTCLTASQFPDPTPALLTAADLPPGWSVGACDCEEIAAAADTGNSSVLQHCLDELDLDTPMPRGDAGIILAGSPAGPLLHHQVALFTPAEAERYMSSLRRFLLPRVPCTWEEAGPNDERQVWRLEEVPLPAVGDDHLAVRLTLESAPLSIVEDVIFVRRGYAVATAELTARVDGGVPDPALLALLARRMDERLMTLPSLP